MRITVLLGGALRHEGGGGKQEFDVELPSGSKVGELLPRLGLPAERIKIIMVNGRGGKLISPIRQGDRVALFPPELSFNTFVSLGFREESVEGREAQRE